MIQHELQRPSHTTYHHHKPRILAAIVDSLLYRAELGLTTILHKIRGHTNISGNDLADVAAKRVVFAWDDIPEHQQLSIPIGRQAERPAHLVMNTKNPRTSHPISHKPTLRDASTTMMDHPGGRKAMHVRLYSPFQTTQTKSAHGNSQKPSSNLTIQAPHPYCQSSGGTLCERRHRSLLTHTQLPKRGHNHPQTPIRPSIQRQACI